MPTIRIDEEVWKYLQSKANPFEDTPNDVLRREFGFEKPVHPPARLQERTSKSDLRAEKDYSHERITGFRLSGRHFQCRTFKDLLLALSNHLRSVHGATFDRIALELRGKKRSYYSTNPARLYKPEQLTGNGLAVETNLNANLIVGICRHLLAELGYDLSKFEIA